MSTGSPSPASYPSNAITIRCDRCDRVGRYKRRVLVERYGSAAAMPDVLNAITACERNHRLSVERCEAYFEELRALTSQGVFINHTI